MDRAPGEGGEQQDDQQAVAVEDAGEARVRLDGGDPGVGRALQRVAGIGRQALRRVLAGVRDDRLPADAAGERVVGERDPLAGDVRAQVDHRARRLQAALAGWVGHRGAALLERDALAVDGEHQAVELAARVRVRLQRGDLGRVDDVAHVDVPALHVHLREVVDAEVAERVRAGRGRKQQEGGEGDGEEAHDHPCAFETPMVLRLAAGRLQQDV